MMPANRNRLLRSVLLLVMVTTVGLAALFVGRRYLWPVSNDANSLELLREAYLDVMEQYVEKPDSKKLVVKMVDGMLASLDPHSAYLPPEPYHEMEVSLSGSFGGVGIELGTKDGKLTVIAPIDGTPAFVQGFRPMITSGR